MIGLFAYAAFPVAISIKWVTSSTDAVGMVLEEVIFRGFVMTILLQMGYGSIVQVFLWGLFFSLAHLYRFASLAAFLLGLALVVTYLMGKRSMTAPIIGLF